MGGLDSSDRIKISSTAQAILDARAKYPNTSFADLYGENMYLFGDLLQGHQTNDLAVVRAYDFAKSMTKLEIVAELMKRYHALTAAKDS